MAAPPLDRETYTAEQLLDEVVRPIDALRAVMAHKRRTHYTVGGCMAELCEIRTDEGSTRSLAIESEDPARVMAAVRSLGLEARANVCMVRGLKVLTGFGLVRYAVIDVGTNSVKLHVGERRADDTWSAVVDRAIVTRLGEGLDATGALGPEPMDRTLEAIAALADEARAAGAAAIAAVGTAGLRAAPNAAAFVGAVEARCGVRIEIIPGEEEGRLAYLAATTGLGLPPGSLVVFDTGGGSSQFTFGDEDAVAEQFSVPVGAVRLTERYGLDRAVSDEALRDALDADRRRARPPRRPPRARRARRDGRRADQPRRRRAGTRGVRPGRRPRHPAGPRRDRPADRALPDAQRRGAARASSACSPTAPRSSSRAPASCAWC